MVWLFWSLKGRFHPLICLQPCGAQTLWWRRSRGRYRTWDSQTAQVLRSAQVLRRSSEFWTLSRTQVWTRKQRSSITWSDWWDVVLVLIKLFWTLNLKTSRFLSEERHDLLLSLPVSCFLLPAGSETLRDTLTLTSWSSDSDYQLGSEPAESWWTWWSKTRSESDKTLRSSSFSLTVLFNTTENLLTLNKTGRQDDKRPKTRLW